MEFFEKVKANFNPVMFVSTMAGVAAIGILQYVMLKSKIGPLKQAAKATQGKTK